MTLSNVKIYQNVPIQQTFTFSKLKIETLEKGVKTFKVNKKDTRTMSMTSFWCLYC